MLVNHIFQRSLKFSNFNAHGTLFNDAISVEYSLLSIWVSLSHVWGFSTSFFSVRQCVASILLS